MELRLYSLTGKFTVVGTHPNVTMAEAQVLVEAHAKSGGYTGVKRIDGMDEIRFTGKTPGGRGGRNIAYIDVWAGE